MPIATTTAGQGAKTAKAAAEASATQYPLHYRVAAVVVATIFALLLAEVALRVAGYSPAYINAMGSFHEADPVSGHRGKRNFSARFKNPQFDVQIVHNAAGFRRQESLHDAGQADRRFYVFGDSFVWGWGVDQGEVFTDQMSRLRPTWRIENFGINGTGTVAQYELFASEVRDQLRPGDTVLLTFFNNDFNDNVTGSRHATIVNGQVVTEPPSSQLKSGWQRTLQESSYLFNFVSYAVNRWQHDRRVRRAHEQAVRSAAKVEQRLGEQPSADIATGVPAAPSSSDAAGQPVSVATTDLNAPPKTAVPPPAHVTPRLTLAGDAQTQITVTRHSLNRWQRDCRERNARLVVAYIPGVVELEAGGNAAMAVEESAARQAFFSLASELSLETIDLLPGMLAAKRSAAIPSLVIAGDGHWNAAGHRVVAEILAAQLADQAAVASAPE